MHWFILVEILIFLSEKLNESVKLSINFYINMFDLFFWTGHQ